MEGQLVVGSALIGEGLFEDMRIRADVIFGPGLRLQLLRLFGGVLQGRVFLLVAHDKISF